MSDVPPHEIGNLTVSDLVMPDTRSLSFGPFGLGGPLPIEVALEHQQRAVTWFSLADVVPDNTRRAFDRLQQIHLYGLLCYELFTVADNEAFLTLDLALADRLLAFYDGEIPFIVGEGPDKDAPRPLKYADWDDIYKALHGGSHTDRNIWLRPKSGGRAFRFTGEFSSLLRWARSEQLLKGQRNRRMEPVYRSIRNRAAHPRYAGIGTPVDSARSIGDVAEIINQLWGHGTPGGRLYPAPLERTVVIVGWGDSGACTWLQLPGLPYADFTETTFIALRAVFNDDVRYYDSIYETTRYPAELLWGPGTAEELRAWAPSAPDHDAVEYLDRLFLVRAYDGQVDQPLRPAVAAGRQGPDREGHWHLVRADHPLDAFGHVRSSLHGSAGPKKCTRVGVCPNCAVQVLETGRLETMLARLRRDGHEVTRERPPAISAPSLFGPR